MTKLPTIPDEKYMEALKKRWRKTLYETNLENAVYAINQFLFRLTAQEVDLIGMAHDLSQEEMQFLYTVNSIKEFPRLWQTPVEDWSSQWWRKESWATRKA